MDSIRRQATTNTSHLSKPSQHVFTPCPPPITDRMYIVWYYVINIDSSWKRHRSTWCAMKVIRHFELIVERIALGWSFYNQHGLFVAAHLQSTVVLPPPFQSTLILSWFALPFLPSSPLLSPSLLRVLRTCGVPLHKHPGLKEALLEMEKQGITSPFLCSTLANLLEGELKEGSPNADGIQQKALKVSAGFEETNGSAALNAEQFTMCTHFPY